MSRRSRFKSSIKDLLLQSTPVCLPESMMEDPQTAGSLLAIIAENDITLAPKAIEALSQVAGHLADDSGDKVVEILRRLQWFMLDESGNAVARAPEAMSAVILAVPSMAEPWTGVITTVLEEPFLQPSALQALLRLADKIPKSLPPHRDTIEKLCQHPEAETRQAVEKLLDKLG